MADRVRNYMIWLTDKEGADHLYSRTHSPVTPDQLYWLWLHAYEDTSEGDLWIEEVGPDVGDRNFLYNLYVEYDYPLIHFGSASNPISEAIERKLVGSYGQLECVFEIMDKNSSHWRFVIEEYNIRGSRAELVIIDDAL